MVKSKRLVVAQLYCMELRPEFEAERAKHRLRDAGSRSKDRNLQKIRNPVALLSLSMEGLFHAVALSRSIRNHVGWPGPKFAS